MRVKIIGGLLLMCAAASAQVRISGASTGASAIPPELSVQVAQQGVKLSEMDININRRLDELGRKMDDMEKANDGLKTDVARLGVFSSIFTFGISSVATILLSVVLAVPLTFVLQHYLRKAVPDTPGTSGG